LEFVKTSNGKQTRSPRFVPGKREAVERMKEEDSELAAGRRDDDKSKDMVLNHDPQRIGMLPERARKKLERKLAERRGRRKNGMGKDEAGQNSVSH